MSQLSVWSLFAAAYATDSSVRNSIVDQIWNRVSSNITNTGIFSTSYKLDNTSAPISNAASPFIGGVFAPLSLSGQNLTLNISESSSSSSPSTPGSTPSGTPGDSSATAPKKSSNAGAIAGGIIGGVGGAALFGLIGFMYWRRRHNRSVSPETGNVDLITEPEPFAYRPTPNPSAMTESSLRRFEMVAAAKSREATSNTASETQPTPSASAYTSTSAVTSSGNPSATEPTMSPTSSDVTALSHSDVQGLRTEVANLRRVMESLQEARYEPPPGYEPETEI
ncbi:hypothetical protein EIP86_005876 [Pleurotus ostreatoroseus]|nr:hypothetical protein EIP86_005876 [Pleurotus ostreatoroseus]